MSRQHECLTLLPSGFTLKHYCITSHFRIFYLLSPLGQNNREGARESAAGSAQSGRLGSRGVGSPRSRTTSGFREAAPSRGLGRRKDAKGGREELGGAPDCVLNVASGQNPGSRCGGSWEGRGEPLTPFNLGPIIIRPRFQVMTQMLGRREEQEAGPAGGLRTRPG